MADTTVFGIRVAYTSSGSGYPLLFLHDIAANKSSFDLQVHALENDFMCLTPDLPGHGSSGQPHVEYSVIFCAEMMLGFLEKLRLKNTVVVGHGFGAAVALSMAALNSKSIRGMILLSPPTLTTEGADRAPLKAALVDSNKSDFRTAYKHYLEKGLFLEGDTKNTRKSVLAGVEKTTNRVGRAILESYAAWEGKRALMELKMPVALLNGVEDRLERATLMHYAKHAQYGAVLGGTHFSHLSQPDQVAAAIRSFATVACSA